MAPVKIEKVVSVSSEDKVHVAANLLKGDFNNKKWKSSDPGEKQISVVLQLEKPSKITSIDVGNENSAFLEVLVAKCSAGAEDFKVLLATTSLMTLKEAKYSENTNAVKFLKMDDLCEDTRNEKWDRVKIVCSQPYNAFTQFGLSFIVFHTDEPSPAPSGPDLGKFRLKTNDTIQSTDSLSAWSLMTKKKEQVETKGAAAVRNGDITLPSAKNKPFIAKVEAISPNDVIVDEEEESATQAPPSASMDSDVSEYLPSEDDTGDDDTSSDSNLCSSEEIINAVARKPKTPKAQQKKDNTPGKALKRNLPNMEDKRTSKKVAKVLPMKPICTKPMKPFNRLMEGVVFVISGFQNPLRSDIRNSALAMGAKYKADWDRSCTHLICAFPNTPKFNQVRGHGKIIKKDWIEKCYESRKRIPWRRFALDPSDQGQPESEEEILEDIRPGPSTLDNRRRLNDSSSEEDDIEKEVKRIQKRQQTTKRKAIVSDEEETSPEDNRDLGDVAGPSGLNPLNSSPLPSVNNSTNSTSKAAALPIKPKMDLSIYEVETEEEEGANDDGGISSTDILQSLPVMPSYFEGFNFLILDDIEESQRETLKRYIQARLGIVVSDVQELSSSSPCYCITEDKSRLEDVKESFPGVVGVRADWIWLCHDENSLQDVSSYIL